MQRRTFVRLLAVAASAKAAGLDAAAKRLDLSPLVGDGEIRTDVPPVKLVSAYKPAATPGMPGPFPGRVISVASDKCVDTSTGQANDEVVKEMMARGMRELTGAASTRDAWARFFNPADVVGIKVNCGGYPYCISAYEIVAETIRQLKDVGVPVSQIYIYERFQNQLDECNYTPHIPEGLQIVAAERANRYADNSGYDPATYLEANLFGEEDTRSNMMRLVSQRLTKIINIPAASRTSRARTSAARPTPTRSSAGSPPWNRCGRGRCCRSWTGSAACGTADLSRERPGTCSTRRRSSSAPIPSPSIGCCWTSSTTSARSGASSRSGIDRRAR